MMSVLSVGCTTCAGMCVCNCGRESKYVCQDMSETHCIPRGRPAVKWSQEGAENKT